MSELAQPTAGETARTLQEASRLFADEIAYLIPSDEHLVRFAEDSKALLPCLDEMVSSLHELSAAPILDHDEWIYQIDTILALLNLAADARLRGHDHVSHSLLFAVESALHYVARYAKTVLVMPLTLPGTRRDDAKNGSPTSTAIH